MSPIITEQLNKFKNGDFGGYESFYNETVNTVYTMLHTVVHDSNVATSLVPQVYDKIYQNVTSLEQTNGFYQWAAELANEEALGYLKENGWTEIHNDSVENTYEQAVDGKFYDYAVEDEALTITEDAVLDTSFVTRVQEIVTTLSPMDRVVFQDYYYFGVSVPEIAVKTGCKDSDIRYTLSQTRTAILQTIALAPVDDSENGNSNIRRYRLAEVPWMWIAYQNFLAYTLGIDTISIAGWLADIFGQIVGSGIAVSGMDAEGTATGAVSNGASSVGACVPAGEATGAAAGSVGASGTSGDVAAIFGTIGGKIAIGIVGTAMVAAIGVGVHHVVTENQSTTEKTAVATMGDASENEIITKYTSYEAVLADLKQCIEQGTTYEASENFTDKSKNKDAFYVIGDFDGDGTDELIIGQWNAVIGGMDIGDVFTMRDGNVIKIFTCNYGYGDNGQSAVLYNDGIIYENAEKINFENEQALECKYVYNIRWRIAGGTCNFDIAKITYSADGEGRSAYQIIFIHDEKALSMFDNTVETGFSAVQNLVDSAPEIYIKPTVNEDLGDGLNIYKTSWKTLYDDNSYMNTDSGPIPDADGKF